MLKRTVVARSIAVAFGVIALGAGVAPTAYAQSNTTGSIYGSVGQAGGTEVTVENVSSGFKRSIKPDASGRYSLVSLPTGTYTVTLLRNGNVVEKRAGVDVLLSQGTDVSFGGTTVVEVRASAIRKIDTSSATSAAVFTAKDLERLPVAGNVGAIIQLAPNTTKGDSRYGGSNAPSFGGASASENAYYINGFPVTTLLTQVGFSQLPFNSIGQAQVLTGGYGAEFGRSTGGVVNIITKRGGNDWEVGGSVAWEPKDLRAKERNMFYEKTGVAVGGVPFDDKLRLYNGMNTDERTTLSAYASGPILKDKLFFFGAVEQVDRKREAVRSANLQPTYNANAATQSNAFQEIDIKIPRYLLKLDWAITDNHTLEYTRIQDRVEDNRRFYGFNYATQLRTGVQNGGQSYVNWGPTPVAAQQGATVDILKYTGYITNDIIVTALYGKTKTEHEQSPVGYNPALPQIALNGAQAPASVTPCHKASPVRCWCPVQPTRTKVFASTSSGS